MEWYSVIEVLPEDMKEVLLFDEVAGRRIGYYHKDSNCFIRELDGLRLERVTHWMPLPDAPIIHRTPFI